MNFLSQFNQLFNRTEQAMAKVVGIRTDGRLIANTQAGATVLLNGVATLGKTVYYDRRTGQVLGEAPDVKFMAFGV